MTRQAARTREDDGVRRRRLAGLMDLACAYRGWSRKQLSEALARDATKLAVPTGSPKLDLVMRLAEILEWPAGDVADTIWAGAPQTERAAGRTFSEIDAEAVAAHRRGDYQGLIRLARIAFDAAPSARERAIACVREFGGWDGLGRFAASMETAQRGLREFPVPKNVRLSLQSNLANAHYVLGNYTEAEAVSTLALATLEQESPLEASARTTKAFALYVRGQTYRASLPSTNEDRVHLAERALRDLAAAASIYEAVASEKGDQSFVGIGLSCAGASIEVEVQLGRLSAEDGLARLLSGLDAVVDLDSIPSGDVLESYGWWCVFACNIAMHHLSDQRQQRAMAIFTNKAYEIAERLNNWALWESVLRMDFVRRLKLSEWSGDRLAWPLDDEDARMIVGAMGRFPSFRPMGWRILEAAGLLEGGE